MDIQDPDGATMLEIVRTIEANRQVKYKSGVRLDNGDFSVIYEQNTESKAGEKGHLSIPATIKLGVPVFDGGTVYGLEAHFRHRIDDGTLVLWYELVRPHKVIEVVVNALEKQLKEQLPDVFVYHGVH